MRTMLLLLLAGMLGVAGCSVNKNSQAPGNTTSTATTNPAKPAKVETKAKSSSNEQKTIVTPEKVLPGKVVLVNAVGRFVVLNFPVGHVPPVDQHLSLFRQGVRVADVKITNQQLDDNVVADLISGQAEAGDEARNE